jgi:hypothetical protein
MTNLDDAGRLSGPPLPLHGYLCGCTKRGSMHEYHARPPEQGRNLVASPDRILARVRHNVMKSRSQQESPAEARRKERVPDMPTVEMNNIRRKQIESPDQVPN